MEAFLKYFALPALCGIAAWIGSFFGAYAKKRGENWATHKDVETLTEDLKATTIAVKEIEAKISTDMWSRQRKWDIRREAVFEALKEIATLQAVTARLAIPFLREKAKMEMVECLNSSSRALIVADVLCSEGVRYQFREVVALVSGLRTKLLTDDKGNEADLQNDLTKALEQLLEVIREDLKEP